VSSAPDPSQFNQVDQLLRSGAISEARKILLATRLPSVRRSQLASFASLCCRADEPILAIRALNPIVRGEKASVNPPTSAEATEYAQALSRIGAAREALDLLETVDGKAHPKALLMLAHAHFAEWNYAASLPLLRSYLEVRLEPYEKLVGEVNLLAALIATGQTEAAEPVIGAAKRDAEALHAHRLLGNCLELEAQLGILNKDFARARRALESASRIFAEGEFLDSLLVRKWKAIASYRENPASKEALPSLRALREEAAKLKYWEGVRDCDYHLAVATGDEELLDRLFYGTPSEHFRARLRKSVAPDWEPGENFVRWYGGRGEKILDLEAAELPPMLVSLLRLLASDLYAPFRTASLFSSIYADEYFNPDTSPHRVQQLIHRLEKEMTSLGLPLKVSKDAQAYSLEAASPFGIRADLLSAQPAPGAERHELSLRNEFKEAAFTAVEAASRLGVSRRTVSRVLKEAIALGKIEVIGEGSVIRYRLKPEQ
jgi:hypothetical protein